jgi:hypothetical protein
MRKGLFLLLVLVMLGFSMQGCIPPSKPSFEFDVQPSTGTFSAAGQTITYTYTAKNPNVAMKIAITDDRFGQPCEPVVIQPYNGSTEATCTFVYTTTEADVQAGVIRNTATASVNSAGDTCCGTDTTDRKTDSAEVVLKLPEAVQVLSAGCDQDLAQMYIAFDTGLEWVTTDAGITYTASDGETSYSCYTSRTGVIQCDGIPGDSPGPLEVCMQKPGEPTPVCFTIADYPSWIAGITCDPDWELNHPGCHSEEEIFFTLDTGFTWLTSNEGVTLSATDGDTTYACTVATDPGRVYCYGPHPDNPGALEFCLQRKGDSKPLCQTYTDYPQSVWSLSCIPPTPTDRPGQNAPGSCASLTTIPACQSNSACTWDTSANKCVSK